MFPGLFLDRDGVIIENNPNYVRTWQDVQIFPPSIEALVRAAATPYKIVIVTNQSAIGRGLLSPQMAAEINQRLVEHIVRAGGRVDGVFVCPHTELDGCDCRKPLPGLILQAAASHSIDLSRSIMLGDALSDLQAGQAAGVAKTVLVKSGRGEAQSLLPAAATLQPYLVYANLAEALADLI